MSIKHRVLACAASVNHVGPRYVICMLVHILLVLIRGAMLIVSITRLDRRWSFPADHLSTAQSTTNYVTTVFSAAVVALSQWALQPLAVHRAFTHPQTLTTLHDRLSAWSGSGAAVQSVLQNRDRRHPLPLLVTLVYFVAVSGVSTTFSPSFTFENYNETAIFYPTLNSITTALTSLGDLSYLLQSQAAAAYLVTTFAFLPDENVRLFLTGLGNGTIFDTLVSPASPISQTIVPALAAGVTCGEVPQANWTVAVLPVSPCLNVTVNGTFNERPMGTSYSLSPDWVALLTNSSATFYKLLEEPDISKSSSSRNLYLMSLSFDPSVHLTDSRNSTGDLTSQSMGPLTTYTKVIGCSLTMTNTTITIDGLNQPLDGTDVVAPSAPHAWFNAAPLPSRGLPWEDLFSGLYTYPASGEISSSRSVLPSGISLSLFEELLNERLYFNKTLGFLEDCLMIATTYSYAVLGVVQGYSGGLSAAARAAGWNPKPTSATTTIPVLRARLHMPLIPTLLGFVASLVCLAAARIIVGSFPPLHEKEELIANTGLLPIISMLRRSSIPATVNAGIDDASASNEAKLRRIGANLEVHVSRQYVLDVVKGPDDDKAPSGTPTLPPVGTTVGGARKRRWYSTG